jgi:hypothetical protein
VEAVARKIIALRLGRDRRSTYRLKLNPFDKIIGICVDDTGVPILSIETIGIDGGDTQREFVLFEVGDVVSREYEFICMCHVTQVHYFQMLYLYEKKRS